MDDPRALLRRYGLAPRKALGQNFLVDPHAPARIAACAEIGAADTVIEVGAGMGTLTAELAARAGRVIAVETDPHLIAVLRQELADCANVTLVHADILAVDPAALLNVSPPPAPPLWGTRLPQYLVVANLPYYITSAVMRHLLEATVRPARMVVTVQREVARRMVAAPGHESSLLTVSLQCYGAARICLRLKPGAFYPPPQVESAVVRLDSYTDPPIPVADLERFFAVARAGFAQRRKQLRNTLAAALHLPPDEIAAALERVGIDPQRRAETLTLAEWGAAANALDPWLGEQQLPELS